MESLISSIEFNVTTLVTLAIGAVVLYVIVKDIVKWNTGKPAPEVKKEEVVPQAPSEPSAPAAVSTLPAEPKTEDTIADPEEKPVETAKEAMPAEDPELDNLLDGVLDYIDDEENKIDQAWDKVTNNRQVSTHVSGLSQFMESGRKAFAEAADRSKEAQKEGELEKRRIKKAHESKKSGNEAYEAGMFREAAKHYSESIKLSPDSDPMKYLLYSNRSAANRQLCNYDFAMIDAEKCITVKPDFAKGYTRKAQVLEDMNRWGEAKALYQTVLQKFKGDTLCVEAKKSLERCDEKLEEQLDQLLDN